MVIHNIVLLFLLYYLKEFELHFFLLICKKNIKYVTTSTLSASLTPIVSSAAAKILVNL